VAIAAAACRTSAPRKPEEHITILIIIILLIRSFQIPEENIG